MDSCSCENCTLEAMRDVLDDDDDDDESHNDKDDDKEFNGYDDTELQ